MKMETTIMGLYRVQGFGLQFAKVWLGIRDLGLVMVIKFDDFPHSASPGALKLSLLFRV